MHSKVKIGIVLYSEWSPLWIYKVVEKLVHSDFSAINLVLYTNRVMSTNHSGKACFIRLHEKIDRYLARNRIDYDKIANLTELLQGVTTISKYLNLSDNKLEHVADEIIRYDLDILLDFTGCTTNDVGIPLARYGTWIYEINNSTINRLYNGYWELVNKIPELGVVLRSIQSFVIKESVLFRSWIPTNFNSIHLNLDHAYGLCSVIVPRIIKRIYQYGPEYLNKLILKQDEAPGDHNNHLFLPPSNAQALKNMFRVLFRYLYTKIVYQGRQKWFVAFRTINNPCTNSSGSYTPLMPPKDRFWADPFIIHRNNKVYIFIEEFLFRTNKGHIAFLELDGKDRLTRSGKILDKEYHMSYPFLFEHNHDYYMIPETFENKSIQLYICERFPDKWNFVMNLKEHIAAMDTTLFYYKNKWWLFTAVNESSGFHDFVELFLFYSDHFLTSNWIPHPCNPIVSDIRNARPAGRIFLHENNIYRPSQDCSGSYGRAFNLNQIVSLSETTFKEVTISKTQLNRSPDLIGTHTFNFDKELMVIDACRIDKRISLNLLMKLPFKRASHENLALTTNIMAMG